MPKLFVSYRRKSWPFTHRLADELRARLDAEIFVDFTGIDDTDFEKSILGHLRTSAAVLLVISAETFVDRIHRDDDWVRREIREAFINNIPLVLVCVEGLLPPAGLPDDIKDVARMQGINFYPEYFAAAVEKLADFVTKISPAQLRTTPAVQPSRTTEPASSAEPPVKQKSISGRTTLSDALDLLENGDHSKAIFLLESLRDSGYQSNAFNIHDLLRKAQTLHDTAERRRIAQINYDDIAELASRKITLDEARTAFTQWRTDYPDLLTDLDTHNLRERFKPIVPQSSTNDDFDRLWEEEPEVGPFTELDTHNLDERFKPVQHLGFTGELPWLDDFDLRDAAPKTIAVLDILPPPFEWIEIPAGKVTIEPSGKTTFDFPAFTIAKYPITNAQYQVFIDAPDGYANPKWWDYSPDAQKWRTANSQPGATEFPGATLPRTNVNWYESVAFCRWLTARLSTPITLPTKQQWQRAAQGDTNWKYPWGDKFDPSRANTDESNIKQPTPVTQYPTGASPFGVMDMIGNVWEWCSTKYGEANSDLTGTDNRVIRGGSFATYRQPTSAAYLLQLDPSLAFSWDDSYIGFRVVVASSIS